MYLELTDIENAEMYGGALGFAFVPWTISVEPSADIRLTVRRALHAFITQHGPNFFDGWRLVVESRDEWNHIRSDGHLSEALASLGGLRHVTPKDLADWVGIQSVAFAWDLKNDLTPLELACASQITAILDRAQAAQGGRPTHWNLNDPIARQNLRRVAVECGVTFEDGLTTYLARVPGHGIVEIG